MKPLRNQIETAMYQWSEWSECSTECFRKRTRACPDGFDCEGGRRQKRNCSIERESVGLQCWGEKTDLIPQHLKNCSLKPVYGPTRIVQGNDYENFDIHLIIDYYF